MMEHYEACLHAHKKLHYWPRNCHISLVFTLIASKLGDVFLFFVLPKGTVHTQIKKYVFVFILPVVLFINLDCFCERRQTSQRPISSALGNSHQGNLY